MKYHQALLISTINKMLSFASSPRPPTLGFYQPRPQNLGTFLDDFPDFDAFLTYCLYINLTKIHFH